MLNAYAVLLYRIQWFQSRWHSPRLWWLMVVHMGSYRKLLGNRAIGF